MIRSHEFEGHGGERGGGGTAPCQSIRRDWETAEGGSGLSFVLQTERESLDIDLTEH